MVPTFVRQHRVEANVLSDERLQQLDQFSNHLIRIKIRKLQYLSASEAEQLLGERSGLLGGFERHRQVLITLIIALQAIHGKSRIALHALQEIVELVRDATGQSSKGFHFLGLPQFFFTLTQRFVRPLALGAALATASGWWN